MRESMEVDFKKLLRQAASASPNTGARMKSQAFEEGAKRHDSGELDDGVLSLEELGEWPHPSVVRDR